MGPLGWIIASTALISLIAWVGALVLYVSDELLDRILILLVALAAGGLVGGAFLHLLPEAIDELGPERSLSVFGVAIAGFCAFFVLEGLIDWHHHHAAVHRRDAVTYLVLLSDAVHNFVDGVVIAGAFVASIPLGIVTAAVIAAHEVPQEIGDFGVLVYGGFDRRRALVLNYATQSTVILGGLVGSAVAGTIPETVVYVLPFAAGSFLYIAASDLIPEIKAEGDSRHAVIHFTVFLSGILVLFGIKLFAARLG